MTYDKNDLRTLFQKPFNISKWIDILVNLFGAKELRATPESLGVQQEQGCGYYLGSLNTADNCKIGLFHYEITKGSVAHKRVGLRNLVKSFINPMWGEFDTALVVFSDNDHWRLSYISDIKGEKTSPKRFTFVFGEADSQYNTAVNRFAELQQKGITQQNIKDAFSVEVLTKEFYNDLFNWYVWAVDSKTGVTFPNNTQIQDDDREGIDTKIIRLITRIMFVWFIKQKQLVPNAIFEEQELSNILRDFDPQSTDNGNYYNAILQNLFFATLNRAIEDEEKQQRGFAKGERKDLKTLYRYGELFSISEDKVIELFAEVPFLNGGLFECLDKTRTIDGVEKAYNYDGFSRNDSKFKDGKYRYRAFVPNQLFFEHEKGLFSILKRYNFTIEENSTNEQTVALDPELLGKVFENLLGVYNPETQESARKSSGSFYTPREIVNYMVDESLIAYLGDTPLVRGLFADNFTIDELRRPDYQAIAGKLKSIKVIDPACGSGAFPMGLLNRVVDILKRITIDKSDYQLKLNLIENCIYGVDIQPIATQISKLRFFISLICDCQRDPTKPNFGIPTLPNLETKFVCANTLISSDLHNYNNDWTTDKTLLNYKNELLEIRHKHFNAKTANEKKGLRKKDEEVSQKICDYIIDNPTKPDKWKIEMWRKLIKKNKLELQKYQDENWVDEMIPQGNLFGNPQPTLFRRDVNKEKRDELNKTIKSCQSAIDKEINKAIPQGFEGAVEQVTRWNPYDQNASSPFFDPEWMFGVKDGFDIVIGNPPYISTKAVSDNDKKSFEKEFGFADDTYNHFFFKGYQLLTPAGTLTYITPKTFWTTQTKRNLRDLIFSKRINYIFDTANPFESAMVDTCITSFTNQTPNHNEICFLDGSKDLSNPLKYTVSQEVYLNTQNYVIFKPTSENMRIYEKYGQKVKELNDKWWDKIKTSRDIEKNKAELEAYRASLKPGDVALLGCLTEGGQGLATANNGKYIAVRKSTKWAKNILESRPKKLAEAIQKKKIQIQGLENYANTSDFLASLSETDIAKLFDDLKTKYGRDIFGQGYIYRLIDDDEIADVDSLTQDEKDNGIETSKKYYVPYDKGDKDGNRWYLETPFAIAWSKENVRFLKTNSGKKGEGMPVVRNPQFYFREGFCWTNILNPQARLLKTKMKTKSVNDVGSMALYSMSNVIPNYYYVALLNSELLFDYYREYINCTVNIQINDIRQLPIVIPTTKELVYCKSLFDKAIEIKKLHENIAELENIENKLNDFVNELYAI